MWEHLGQLMGTSVRARASIHTLMNKYPIFWKSNAFMLNVHQLALANIAVGQMNYSLLNSCVDYRVYIGAKDKKSMEQFV